MTDVGMFLLIKAESRGAGAVGAPPTLQPCSVATCLGPGKQLGVASEKLPDPGRFRRPPLPPRGSDTSCLPPGPPGSVGEGSQGFSPEDDPTYGGSAEPDLGPQQRGAGQGTEVFPFPRYLPTPLPDPA